MAIIVTNMHVIDLLAAAQVGASAPHTYKIGRQGFSITLHDGATLQVVIKRGAVSIARLSSPELAFQWERKVSTGKGFPIPTEWENHGVCHEVADEILKVWNKKLEE